MLALATGGVAGGHFRSASTSFIPRRWRAPLLLLLVEARLAERYGRFWLWFVAVLAVKENMAPLLFMYGAVFAVLEGKRGRPWQIAWNFLPMGLAVGWLLVYGKGISPDTECGERRLPPALRASRPFAGGHRAPVFLPSRISCSARCARRSTRTLPRLLRRAICCRHCCCRCCCCRSSARAGS
ncbi:MAG: hypothetical protein WDN28_25430 [Chthoniobacter sp.]